jgi:hypothetical protein
MGKKLILVGFAVSIGLAQEINPQKRVHTRPPYSRPLKHHGKLVRQAHHGPGGRKAGHPQPKADHVIVR